MHRKMFADAASASHAASTPHTVADRPKGKTFAHNAQAQIKTREATRPKFQIARRVAKATADAIATSTKMDRLILKPVAISFSEGTDGTSSRGFGAVSFADALRTRRSTAETEVRAYL